MTSISSAFGAATMFAPGTTVKSADKTAFSSAITDIVNGLKSGASATAGASTVTSGTATTTTVKDRVDGLIDKEVSDGKLSTDQATELKSLLAKAAGHMHVHAPKSSTTDATTDLASTDDTTTDALGVSTTDATGATTGGSSIVDEATQALGGLISGIKSAAAATGLYGAGGITHGGLGSLLIHAFV